MVLQFLRLWRCASVIIYDLKFKWKGNLKSILWLFVNAVKLSHARAP